MKAILLIDHGSRKKEANDMLTCMANLVQTMAGNDVVVRSAHMEIAEPTVEAGFASCVDAGATHVIVFPYMLSPGRHSTADIPRMIAEVACNHEGVTFPRHARIRSSRNAGRDNTRPRRPSSRSCALRRRSEPLLGSSVLGKVVRRGVPGDSPIDCSRSGSRGDGDYTMMRRTLIAGLCAASGLACATTSGSSTPPVNQRVLVSDESHSGAITTSSDASGSEAVIAAPVDKVWAALLVAYPELGIQVLSINRPSGEIGNRNFRILHKLNGQAASMYLNCGFDALIGPQANSYPIDASMLTVVRADTAGTTHIATRLSGSAKKIGAVADPLYCGTTGALERQLNDAVNKHVAP